MTTLGRYVGIEQIVARLESVRGKYFRTQVARSAAGVITVGCISLIIAGLIGYWPAQPPRVLRWGLLIAMVGIWAGAIASLIVSAIRSRLNYFQAARLVEQSMDGLDNALINAIQLERDPLQSSPALVQSAISETVHRTSKLTLSSAIDTRAVKRRAIIAAAAVLVLCAFGGFQYDRFSRGLSAVFNPNGYIRTVATVKLISLYPGDGTFLAGENLTISARIENPTHQRYKARVIISRNGKVLDRAMISSLDRCQYTCLYGKLEQSFKYAVIIGKSRFPTDKPYYTVSVVQKIALERIDLLYNYPAYTQLTPRKVSGKDGTIEAPIGTVVNITVRLAGQAKYLTHLSAFLRTRSGKSIPMRQTDSGGVYRGTIRITNDDAYQVVITDHTGKIFQQIPDAASSGSNDGYFPIHAVPDAPPKISFVKPNCDVSVSAAEKVQVEINASDDYGVERIELYASKEGQPPVIVKRFEQISGRKSVDVSCAFDLGNASWLPSGEHLKQGDVIVYYASAIDNRRLGDLGGPQTSSTPRFKIIIQDSARVATEKVKIYDLLRQRLMKILHAQQVQLVNTQIIARKPMPLKQIHSIGAEILTAQQSIQADMVDLVENFPFRQEMLMVRKALALLASNEAATAITQAKVLSKLTTTDERISASQALAGTQVKIIRSLQALLAILPSLQNPDAAKKTAEGADIPADVREKLAELKTDLKKFMLQQRKVIEATERLTKKPVDTFTADDEKLLKDLQLAQDKWEKFINEKFADFSKLAQQDFSNPALLNELLSIKCDLTMAKDALSKKAVEIATPLEANGIENAKTLTANIEKWLPDQPDRIKWEMEEPIQQENIEQPELPKELEDLVGDLLEEEEDLFEEMQDITAGYTMSGDKGIGWDAMDGPISNMNAQGVTGNQLPNPSEIAGRSGEGRQGKSLGEFVENKAVGKGGRRTPTRLTPEPFQAGQVKDTSAEPPGGATGGGKTSGAGAQGLEGPLPPPLKKQLKRLAGRHAQLLNKAERIKAGFKVTDFSNYQFLKTITLMERVQSDLENYRYQNALRHQQVLISSLKKTKHLLGGKIKISVESSVGPPEWLSLIHI